MDLVKRALPAFPAPPDTDPPDPRETIRSWLQAGLTTRRKTSAFYLARKPIVILDLPALRGTFIWRGPAQPR